jgi:CHAT domain-containing protein
MQSFIIKSILFMIALISLVSCTSNLPPILPTPVTSANNLMAQGLTQFERGEFASAASAWQPAADLYEQSGNINLYINALIRLSESYQRLGHYSKALSVLEDKALQAAEHTHDPEQIAAVLGNLGQLYFLLGQFNQAQSHLNRSIQLAQQPALQALGLLHLAQVLTVQQNYSAAQSQLTQSIKLAQQNNQPWLAIKALMNQVWLFLERGNKSAAHTQLTSLWSQLQPLPNNHEKAYLLIKFSQFAQQLDWPLSELQPILTTAITLAKEINDQYALSQAQGQLGHRYEQAQQYPLALQFTQQARFAAEQVHALNLLYHWEWQAGRLLNAQHDRNNAISAYQRAKAVIAELQLIPQESNTNCQPTARPDFNTVIKPLLLELADLLLQRSQTAADNHSRQADRRTARAVIESFKQTELQDYFKDECITQVLGKPREIDEIADQTAVIYPIVFEQRLELLLSLPNQAIQQVTQAVTAQQFRQTVSTLRTQLENNAQNDNYLKPAQQLYTWLIQPIVPTLKTHQVNTLVVVPESSLRTIPLAVLHDGNHFLIEQYAVVTTTSVTLTAPNSNTLTAENISVLSSGLTQVTPEIKAQGYHALIFADEVLDFLQQQYPQSYRQLKGKLFTYPHLQDEWAQKPYRLLNINSHAQFAHDFDNTFIVTYDDKMKINQLEKLIKTGKYRDNPLELLTLSACETAKGDERAALGLSGIALKAGARSVLATLWKSKEAVAYHLTLAFYQHLKQSRLSKAQALQQAQQTLLTSQFKHPHDWSPFILIGNWL